MAYQALYRVWRSQRFDDLVGQEAITKTLKNAIQQQKTSHAYLFTGPRGTGKTSAAKILPKPSIVPTVLMVSLATNVRCVVLLLKDGKKM